MGLLRGMAGMIQTIFTLFLYLNVLLSRHDSHSFALERLVSRTRVRTGPSFVLAATRYGPPPDVLRQPLSDDGRDDGDDQLKRDFQDLVDRVVTVKDPSHLPSLLSKNMDLILRVSAPDRVGVVESALQEMQLRNPGDEAAELMDRALDVILAGAEGFVEQAQRLDSQNKKLLGKVIRVLADKGLTDRDREDALDVLMEGEVENFTPGFLRYVESECERVAGAPKLSPESTRLLQILRLVQTRAVEELGRGLGEAAQVLGQLVGYESVSERLAVLDAGVTVRGLEFATEMLSLAEEALDGFTRVPDGADPDLVNCVQGIRERLVFHVDGEESFR
jgi:hypothetical protein